MLWISYIAYIYIYMCNYKHINYQLLYRFLTFQCIDRLGSSKGQSLKGFNTVSHAAENGKQTLLKW